MENHSIRIATRKSPLAVWQAEHVAARLRAAHPEVSVELVGMTTKGDRILDSPLAKIGGKGLFVKELEQGILEQRADIAVHSMKDVPVDFPEGLHLPVIMAREDPRDAFVSSRFANLDALPRGARLGTASLRRQCQVQERRPDLEILVLRGNVNTRLRKLDEGQYDAVVLAVAGLKRMGFDERIAAAFAPEEMLPAIGQGVIGVECRRDDERVNGLLRCLEDAASTVRVRAERAFNARLGGSCQVPLAAYAELEGDALWLRGLVGRPDGTHVVRGEARGVVAQAAELGRGLAEELLGKGAGEILAALHEAAGEH